MRKSTRAPPTRWSPISRARLAELPGQSFSGLTVERADDFAYHDPVDGSVTTRQGLRIFFSNGSRIVYRLSGTGTAGATLRVYIEQFEGDSSRQDLDPQSVLADLIALSRTLPDIPGRTGRSAPDVIT